VPISGWPDFKLVEQETHMNGPYERRSRWQYCCYYYTASYQWLDWKKVSFVTQYIHFTKVFPFNFATHYSHTVQAWNVPSVTAIRKVWQSQSWFSRNHKSSTELCEDFLQQISPQSYYKCVWKVII
jgi:hypothetical protein